MTSFRRISICGYVGGGGRASKVLLGFLSLRNFVMRSSVGYSLEQSNYGAYDGFFKG
ncbi:hypothetical protein M408DRAFT_164563 [Serendipita vermifera MAFF 305830]|uniref:Uncharacterized protein n=1 Tax=Serendipita vermifera MAFF 305830 TaxID=933852 RepID=A0A0C3AIY1_SERVB|nr:hypothetical protein M408DRAFT_164563 [Serendipita vermifera MAFF 305830]